MAALWNSTGHYFFILWFLLSTSSLWSPYGIGQAIIFCPVVSSISLLSFFSSSYLSGRRVDVYHTSTHGAALVQI